MTNVIVSTPETPEVGRLVSTFLERVGGYAVTTTAEWPPPDAVAQAPVLLVLRVRGRDEQERAEAIYADVPLILIGGNRTDGRAVCIGMPFDLNVLLNCANTLSARL